MIGSIPTQRTEQPAGRKRGAGGRPAVDRIPEETVAHRDSRWDIPRKRALFTSDEPDSTTSGSDILEGHADEEVELLLHRKGAGGTDPPAASPEGASPSNPPAANHPLLTGTGPSWPDWTVVCGHHPPTRTA